MHPMLFGIVNVAAYIVGTKISKGTSWFPAPSQLGQAV